VKKLKSKEEIRARIKELEQSRTEIQVELDHLRWVLNVKDVIFAAKVPKKKKR